MLHALLADDKAPSHIRATAASHIGRLGHVTSLPLLVEQLGVGGEQVLLVKLLAALGRSGTPEVLPALAKLNDSDNTAVTRHARFAQRVIAYRHGLPIEEDNESKRLMPHAPAMRPIAITATTREELATAQASLGTDTYGIALDAETSVRIDCASRSMLVLLNANCRGIEALTHRPQLAGVIALRAPASPSYAVSRLVLTRPRKGDAVEIDVYLIDGVLVQTGRAERKHDCWHVSVASVEASGNSPVELLLELHSGGIKTIRALSAVWATERQHPEPFVPPKKTILG